MKKPTKQTITWRRITENRLFFPIVALTLILLFDFIFIPGFFAIENREGNLHGSLIDIFRNGSTVMILAIGMTLVIATGGVDLSVGATMAIAASVAGILMNPSALKNEVFFVTDPNYTFQRAAVQGRPERDAGDDADLRRLHDTAGLRGGPAFAPAGRGAGRMTRAG